MLGMRHMFDELVDRQFSLFNITTRKEVTGIAKTIRRVEEKLDRLLPEEADANRQEPTRARRSPSATSTSWSTRSASFRPVSSRQDLTFCALPGAQHLPSVSGTICGMTNTSGPAE
jgi:hypothetical protein